MSNLVMSGAILTCSCGTAPCTFQVVDPTVMGEGARAATVMDYLFPMNITGFGLCTSSSNPTVAALGIPEPCTPVLLSPWIPGKPQALIRGQPALDADSKLFCAYAGVISVTFPGNTSVEVN